MEKNILLKTNIIVSVVIIIGFIITSVMGFYSNKAMMHDDIEHVTLLTSEGIYHQIDAIFTKPINISLTMANDSLLKSMLSQESEQADEDEYINKMTEYLNTYRNKYNYESIFLVSTETDRYYHFNGINRVLDRSHPQDEWYTSFIDTKTDYAINIDDDEAANGEITFFINCKIYDDEGEIIGVVGVGFLVDYIQDLFKLYEDKFNVEAYMINEDGDLIISTNRNGYNKYDFFDNSSYESLKDDILINKLSDFWYNQKGENGYVVSEFISNLNWFLLIDYSTTDLNRNLHFQLAVYFVVIILVIITVLILIMKIINKYNSRIIELTRSKENENRTILQEATKKLYSDIYEMDITHNRAASDATEQYFARAGAPKGETLDKSLVYVANKFISEEHRQGYLDTFTSANVLNAYRNGIDTLKYDFLYTNGDDEYFWMRITAKIFYWEYDKSIRMVTYRQNINNEKILEQQTLENIQKDSLTGLYNKIATQEHIRDELNACPEKLYAFFILDIDNFKFVNDGFGHAVGDEVIIIFANTLRSQFRRSDIVGRIGGDEFAAFLEVPSLEWLDEKAKTLVEALNIDLKFSEKPLHVSPSIGISVSNMVKIDFETLYKNADNALYDVKKKGKNGYSIN